MAHRTETSHSSTGIDLHTLKNTKLLRVVVLLCVFSVTRTAAAQSDDIHRCGPATNLIVGRWQARANPSHVLHFRPDGEVAMPDHREEWMPEGSQITYALDTLRAAPRTAGSTTSESETRNRARQVLTLIGENGQGARYQVHQLSFDTLVLLRESKEHAAAGAENAAQALRSAEAGIQYERLPDAWAGGVEIVGPPRFVQQTQAALQLLRKALAAHDRFFRHYIRRVQRHCPSGATIWRRTGLVHISDRLASLPPPAYASVLVHEAVHVYQYVRAGQNTPPGEQVSLCSPASEREALQQQVAVLRALDRDHPLLPALTMENGRYVDQDNDGDCDAHDYARRNY